MITVEDVRDFGGRWFDTVMSGGSAADQAAFFRDPHSRIYVLSNGATFDFEEHHKLHTQSIDVAVHRSATSTCCRSMRRRNAYA